MDDFSNTPVSIGEARAARDHDGTRWTPRDALVSVLRDIDAGRLDIDTVFIAMRTCDAGGEKLVTYAQASVESMLTVGVAHTALARFQRHILP